MIRLFSALFVFPLFLAGCVQQQASFSIDVVGEGGKECEVAFAEANAPVISTKGNASVSGILDDVYQDVTTGELVRTEIEVNARTRGSQPASASFEQSGKLRLECRANPLPQTYWDLEIGLENRTRILSQRGGSAKADLSFEMLDGRRDVIATGKLTAPAGQRTRRISGQQLRIKAPVFQWRTIAYYKVKGDVEVTAP